MRPWKAEHALVFLRLRTRGPVRAGNTEVTMLCKDTAPGANCFPLSVQQLYQLPHKQLALLLVVLAAHTQYLLSNTDAKISCWKGHLGPKWPGKRGVFLMCLYLYTQDTLSQFCKQTGAINWKFPGFPAVGEENWHWTKARSTAITRHRSCMKTRFRLLDQKMFFVFSHLFAELVQPFPTL